MSKSEDSGQKNETSEDVLTEQDLILGKKATKYMRTICVAAFRSIDFRLAHEVRADELLLHIPAAEIPAAEIPAAENFADSSQVLAGEGGVSDEPEAMGLLEKRTRDCTLQSLNTCEGDARSQTPVSSGSKAILRQPIGALALSPSRCL